MGRLVEMIFVREGSTAAIKFKYQSLLDLLQERRESSVRADFYGSSHQVFSILAIPEAVMKTDIGYRGREDVPLVLLFGAHIVHNVISTIF